ncbi:ribonuclease H-like domain-containing protein [Tanacetum coccineum]
MTLTGAWKKEIWLKGLLAESGYELSLVAGIATGALVKGMFPVRGTTPAVDVLRIGCRVIESYIEGIREVRVYTLSTRAWRKVSLKQPYRPHGRRCRNEAVCVEGFIYWLEHDDMLPPFGNGCNSIVSFDLSNDEFGKVYLPNSLLHIKILMLSNWNECLIVFDYSDIYDHLLNFWDVWMMKDDGVTQSFTMVFRIESNYPKYYNVLEFRKNGEAIIETLLLPDHDDVDPILQVYDPCS